MYKTFLYVGSALIAFLSFSPAYAWNGKTHKWLSQEAVSFLPQEQQEFFNRYKQELFRGVVRADNYRALHHTYFGQDGRIYDDSAALFSEFMADQAVRAIHDARRRGEVREDDERRFAIFCGMAIHGPQDMHGFHTIPREDQKAHARYENRVDQEIRKSEEGFDSSFQLEFDGTLTERNVKQAVAETARDSHFGRGSIYSARELQDAVPARIGKGRRVDWWTPELQRSTKRILEVGANRSAEVLQSLYIEAFLDRLPEQAPEDVEMELDLTDILVDQE